jgi:uncharacterized DUF497 family protein
LVAAARSVYNLTVLKLATGIRVADLEINQIIWIDKFADKIETKHSVTIFEVEEILRGQKKVRRIVKGDVQGEDVYLALGQTDAGRYLAVFFILKRNHNVLPISARDMDSKERRQYGRK